MLPNIISFIDNCISPQATFKKKYSDLAFCIIFDRTVDYRIVVESIIETKSQKVAKNYSIVGKHKGVQQLRMFAS